MENELSQNTIINITPIECYICYEECLDLSPCDCKTLYIHKECFKKLVTKNKDVVCKICKKEYTNLKIESNYTSYITPYGEIIICKNIILIMLSVCFIVETYIGIIHLNYLLYASGLILFSIFLLFYSIRNNLKYMNRENISIIGKKEHKKIIFINELI
jgi:E3 ubiquitin-protein ligase DOA10